MKKLVNIISPCILVLAYCLIGTIIELVEYLEGEAFADVFFFTFLLLSLVVILIDIATKKITKQRKAYFWPLQLMLLIGLFFLAHAIVGGMFSGFV